MGAPAMVVVMTNSTSTRVIAPIAADAASQPIHHTSAATSSIHTRRRTGLRRSVAGLVAATTIAFGGTSLLGAADAQAAGVQVATPTHVAVTRVPASHAPASHVPASHVHVSRVYAVQPDTLQVRAGAGRSAL